MTVALMTTKGGPARRSVGRPAAAVAAAIAAKLRGRAPSLPPSFPFQYRNGEIHLLAKRTIGSGLGDLKSGSHPCLVLPLRLP